MYIKYIVVSSIGFCNCLYISASTTSYSHTMSSTAPNTVPGGQRTLTKRRQAQAVKQKQSEKKAIANSKTNDSTNNILKIYNDENNGLKVDPLVVLFLAVGFIFSVVALHVISKMLTGSAPSPAAYEEY